MDEPPSTERSLEAKKEEAVGLLGEHFARDSLTLDELERRIDAANAAGTVDELREALAGLPSLPGEPGALREVDRELAGYRRAQVPATRMKDRDAALAILGGSGRAGRWTPPRHLFAVAVMGGVELDFREARMGPGVTQVTAFALMGGVEIIVPPDLPVEARGLGIMGAFEHVEESGAAPFDPDTPLLRIDGLALMGGVDVVVRYPGESAKEAKKRLREERKEKRRRLRRRGG